MFGRSWLFDSYMYFSGDPGRRATLRTHHTILSVRAHRTAVCRADVELFPFFFIKQLYRINS